MQGSEYCPLVSMVLVNDCKHGRFTVNPTRSMSSPQILWLLDACRTSWGSPLRTLICFSNPKSTRLTTPKPTNQPPNSRLKQREAYANHQALTLSLQKAYPRTPSPFPPPISPPPQTPHTRLGSAREFSHSPPPTKRLG